MPLRIRKEVQDRLKTSLDGASSTDAARREGSADGSSPPPAGAAIVPAPADVNARSAEIEAILALFDLLIVKAADPARIAALKSLTARYLSDDPSEEKLAQVHMLLRRQAAIILDQIKRDEAADGVIDAEPAAPVAPQAAGDPEPQLLPEPQPEPDRLRRGEVDASAATSAAAPLPPEAKRRRILSWLRRVGGAGGGGGKKGGGEGGDGASGVPLRAKLKTAVMASIWIGVGGFTIVYAGALAYVNWMRIEIDSAIVSGNIEPVNAPFDGSIASLLVKQGDRLAEGARYMLIEDPEVEKQVKLMGVKVERAREDLRLKQAVLESEKEKRDEYVAISRNKMEKILSDIEALEKQEKVARERFNRLSDLFKKGIVIRPRVEEASDKLAELTTQLTKARINQKEREKQFESVMAGHFFDGNQVVGRLKEVEAAVQRASAEVDLALEELQVIQQRRQVNRIVASHDSRILKVLRQEGSSVKRGDTVLVVERTDERVVHAFLRQEEISRVAIGDEATVFVPALRARVTARVVQVDRNAAFLDDIDARYSWKIARDGGPKATDKDRTARVTLKFDVSDRDAVNQRLEIGMPTVVSFRRRAVNTVFSGFTDLGG
jgi:multidrug resistance efflux pump